MSVENQSSCSANLSKAFRTPSELRTNTIISLIKVSALDTSIPICIYMESLRHYSDRLYI